MSGYCAVIGLFLLCRMFSRSSWRRALVLLAGSPAGHSAPLREAAAQPRHNSISRGFTPNPASAARPPSATRQIQNTRHFFWRAALVGRFFVLVWGGATMSGCGGGSAAKMPPFGSGLPVVHATPDIRTLEHRMFERVNRDRKKNGLPALTYDERLADAARSHSADMQKNGFFDHHSPTYGEVAQRLTRAGYVYLVSRENLAEAINVDEAEEGLLNSPHHYENLMSRDISSIGIGIVKGGVKDPRNLTVTQIFATPGKKETESEALRQIAQEIDGARKKAGLRAVGRMARLDAMAKHQLDTLAGGQLEEGNLKPVAKASIEELSKNPVANVHGVSVGGQVVVDSSQFSPQGALLQSSAVGYGIAVAYGTDQSGARRLKILYLVGLK